MDKRMVNIVREHSHGIKYGYKIFKDNLSLAFIEQIFCLLRGFVFLLHHLFQNPIKNFLKRRIMERRKGSLFPTLFKPRPPKLHRNQGCLNYSYLLLFRSSEELSASLTFPGWNSEKIAFFLWTFAHASEVSHRINYSETWGECFQ